MRRRFTSGSSARGSCAHPYTAETVQQFLGERGLMSAAKKGTAFILSMNIKRRHMTASQALYGRGDDLSGR
jgi:hypothetical protein